MGEKLVIGPIHNGLQLNRNQFSIDNDAFPRLENAYQWRGRIKRKRGTKLLGRLQRHFDSLSESYSLFTDILFNGSGDSNLLTGFSLQADGSIVPGTVSITDATTLVVYTDPAMDGTLSPSGTIVYASGAVHIVAAAGHQATAIFDYYPTLPVMGLEEFIPGPQELPGEVGFDTKYAYNISTIDPFPIWDVSFYKNPSTPNIQKSVWTPVSWNGFDYQQIWSVNYQGALWVTNGVDTTPTTLNNIGMQFAPKVDIAFVGVTVNTLTVTIANSPLIVGDYVFVNEWTAVDPEDALTLNMLTGYVSASTSTSIIPSNRTVTITFSDGTNIANISLVTYTPGIIQYLTNRSDTTKDVIRWYDGDPTIAPNHLPGSTKGWVNFMPPLTQLSFSIAELPINQYYLVGAKLIWPFKDRLLFLGAVVQASTGPPIYLQDTVVYSQNGTPYYTSVFNEDPTLSTTQFHQLLVPSNQTATPSAWWEDQTGFGGFVSAGIEQAIISVQSNEDVLIVGFTGTQTRLVYTGNDLIPLVFYLINSEYGTISTFSVINMDKGVLTRGNRSMTFTTQTNADRFDKIVPDLVFQMGLLEHGAERMTAQRDYENEWIYFTYPSNRSEYIFPSETLLYNYRDDSWAIFKESYTHYGSFKQSGGITWATLDEDLTWESWDTPWNSYTQTLFQPLVIAGTSQGFILFRNSQDTSEAKSIAIQNIVTVTTGNVSITTITSPNHGLNSGDYFFITDVLGTIASQVNGKIFSVGTATVNTFTIDGDSVTGGTYIGDGLITRMYVPFIQSKQFPVAWGMSRKTRLGPQQYLFQKTDNAQVTLYIYLSQDDTTPYNFGTIVPQSVNPFPMNDGLIYSTIIHTCPESTNLGLTPANINLQMITYPNTGTSTQSYIWHRVNTSLIGDTVQIAITLSDAQMRDPTLTNQFEEIAMHRIILDVSPSQMLA